MFESMTASQQDTRRAFRVEASFDAEIIVGGTRRDVTVRNISPTGAQLEGIDGLSQGRTLTLSIVELGDRDAVVVWADSAIVGLKFLQPIELERFHRWQLATDPASLISPSKLEWLKQLINS